MERQRVAPLRGPGASGVHAGAPTLTLLPTEGGQQDPRVVRKLRDASRAQAQTGAGGRDDYPVVGTRKPVDALGAPRLGTHRVGRRVACQRVDRRRAPNPTQRRATPAARRRRSVRLRKHQSDSARSTCSMVCKTRSRIMHRWWQSWVRPSARRWAARTSRKVGLVPLDNDVCSDCIQVRTVPQQLPQPGDCSGSDPAGSGPTTSHIDLNLSRSAESQMFNNISTFSSTRFHRVSTKPRCPALF